MDDDRGVEIKDGEPFDYDKFFREPGDDIDISQLTNIGEDNG